MICVKFGTHDVVKAFGTVAYSEYDHIFQLGWLSVCFVLFSC